MTETQLRLRKLWTDMIVPPRGFRTWRQTMKKLLLLTCALLALSASLAAAQDPTGITLGWGSCGTTATQANRNFACDDNSVVHNLVGSFVPATGTTEFAGISALVDVSSGATPFPAWWDYQNCRAGSNNMQSVASLGFCLNNPYNGACLQGGGVVGDSPSGPNRRRYQLDWSRSEPGTVTANQRNSAFLLQINSAKSVDEGFGVCAGCQTPMCLVFTRLEVYIFGTPSLFDVIDHESVRWWATWQGGAVGGAGCPGETPTKSATWGSVKAMYR